MWKQKLRTTRHMFRGRIIQREREMQSLGCWIDEKGPYTINIEKTKGKVENVLGKVTEMTSEVNVRIL